MEQLSQHIESLIFTSQGPITFAEMKEALEDSFETKFKKAEVQTAIDDVLEKYKSDTFSFEIVEIANGFQFFTKGAFHGTVGSRLKLTSKKRLSKAALETLAVIAYKQPVIKSECEKIRGVSCDYTIQKLLEKELVSITGRADTPGRPLLYSTSQKFMDYFGLKDISELPKPKDFQLPDQQIGDAAPIEELSVEQREQKTIVLESVADQVAAAILGEEFFPMQSSVEGEETEKEDQEIISKGGSTDEDAEALLEEAEPEAAIDDEPEDSASEAPEMEGENVSAMSEEETQALLEADAFTENEESEDDGEEEVDEEEDAMVAEIEAELKEIMAEDMGDGEVLLDDDDDDDDDVGNDLEEEVDAIAAMLESLPMQETKTATEATTSIYIPTDKPDLVEETAELVFAFESEVDDIAAMLEVLPEQETRLAEEITTPIYIPSEKVDLIEKTIEPIFTFENETDAIAAMLTNLPKGKMIVGLSEEELISTQPILDKIIVSDDDNGIENLADMSSENMDDSLKKKR